MHLYPPQGLKTCAQVLFLILAAFGCSQVVSAQSQANAADLRGYVRDPQGAAVPNATVTAVNTGTHISRSGTSGGDGGYQLVGLPPGNYDITVEARNFKKALLPAVKLAITTTKVLRFT